MGSMEFTLDEYRTGLAHGFYHPPSFFCPYYIPDPVCFNAYNSNKSRWADIEKAKEEIQARTGRKYFREAYRLQSLTYDYSSRTFPMYRFLLPEVMTEDWLAIVDWGKYSKRDHVLHQPLCGYIALKLLGESMNGEKLILPGGSSLIDICVDYILKWEETSFIRRFLIDCGMSSSDPLLDGSNPIAKNAWRAFLKETSYVAAVFHDIGYPWAFSEKVNCNLHEINTPAVRVNKNSAQIVSEFRHRLLFGAMRGFNYENCVGPSEWLNKLIGITDVALSSTHGFPGALGFLHLNDCVQQKPSSYTSPMHMLCVEWIAVAIMMHDMSKIYWNKDNIKSGMPQHEFLRLSFKRDPLSALTTFADVLQEFERPTARFTALGDDVKLEYDKACVKTEIYIDGANALNIVYFMNTAEDMANKKPYLADLYREYFDKKHGYLDMSSLGLSDVKLDCRVKPLEPF